MPEFFPSKLSRLDDRIDLLEQWAAEFSGRRSTSPASVEQSLATVAGSSVSGSSSSGSVSSLMGDVTGPASANTVKKLNNIALAGVPAVGNVYSYTGSTWTAQDFVAGHWGVGSFQASHRLWIDDNQFTSWFNGTSDSLALGSRGWHISKDKTLAKESTWAWHSDGAAVWEIGMDSDTNNVLNFGFGAADWLMYDTTGNSNAGRIISRIAVEEATTNGTAPKWRFGRGCTLSPRDSTTMFEIRGLDVDLSVLRVRAQDFQVAPMQEWQDGSGNTELQVTADGDLQFSDGLNLIAGTVVGTMIGTSPTQMLGFYGAFPLVQPGPYTPSNVSTDRSYDANATTLDELSDVVGTLIADLQLLGLVG